ncbi:hypothetical protein AX774_g72 [Zancudomyces culisetae]|uniref:Uncharacterized protein n=1 Tax=Zancudomyces culisetae TaxID=1213189 RepID=A0A1R1PZG9_ZANCU|nr:hypothetical protein AX774_g72 [Zancudomyces culisetae]|eukprot:OMH86351.1 hypothetical protein AX774_g72 [Zancudomyces culisetae]
MYKILLIVIFVLVSVFAEEFARNNIIGQDESVRYNPVKRDDDDFNMIIPNSAENVQTTVKERLRFSISSETPPYSSVQDSLGDQPTQDPNNNQDIPSATSSEGAPVSTPPALPSETAPQPESTLSSVPNSEDASSDSKTRSTGFFEKFLGSFVAGPFVPNTPIQN